MPGCFRSQASLAATLLLRALENNSEHLSTVTSWQANPWRYRSTGLFKKFTRCHSCNNQIVKDHATRAAVVKLRSREACRNGQRLNSKECWKPVCAVLPIALNPASNHRPVLRLRRLAMQLFKLRRVDHVISRQVFVKWSVSKLFCHLNPFAT